MSTIYKISKIQINTLTNNLVKLLLLCLITINFSCNDDDCEYSEVFDCIALQLNIGDPCDSNEDGVNDGTIDNSCRCIQNITQPPPCVLQSRLNLSTGIDENENVITPALGAKDPYWRIINAPKLINCNAATSSTFTGDAYVINYDSGSGGQGPDSWVNQSGSSTLAPFDFGIGTSNCSNPLNGNNEFVPYVYERPFCVLEDATVDFRFSYRADNEIYFDLIDNSSDLPVGVSSTIYVYGGAPNLWTATALNLPAGSYSLRGYHVNYDSVLGMSLVGSIGTTNGDDLLSNNKDECCENNVISILNILDENCNDIFDNGVDAFGVGYDFILLDSSNSIIRSGFTDVNGNVFFAGLPDGTYTVQIVNQAGWTPSNPASGQVTVSVSENSVHIQEFYNCSN